MAMMLKNCVKTFITSLKEAHTNGKTCVKKKSDLDLKNLFSYIMLKVIGLLIFLLWNDQ